MHRPKDLLRGAKVRPHVGRRTCSGARRFVLTSAEGPTQGREGSNNGLDDVEIDQPIYHLIVIGAHLEVDW